MVLVQAVPSLPVKCSVPAVVMASVVLLPKVSLRYLEKFSAESIKRFKPKKSEKPLLRSPAALTELVNSLMANRRLLLVLSSNRPEVFIDAVKFVMVERPVTRSPTVRTFGDLVRSRYRLRYQFELGPFLRTWCQLGRTYLR